jgi:gliding motility-associated-like protein
MKLQLNMCFSRIKISIGFLILVVMFLFRLAAISQCTGLSLLATANPINCLTSTTSGTVTCSNGTGAVSYTWLPTGGNSSVAINLSPNTYTIYAKDATGCTGSTNLIIFNNTNVNIIFSTTNVPCFGQNTGQISANVLGTIGPLSYSWTPAAPNASLITNLTPNVYTLAVTDALSCTHVGTVAITSPPAINAIVATKTIACNGAMSGATITTGGGIAPYTYSWSSTTNTSNIANTLPAGSYSVTITDLNGCTKLVPINITEPPPIQNTLTLTHASCNSYSNASASSNITGGTPAYSYTWFPVNLNSSSIGNVAAGNYTLLVKDSKNCTYTQSFAITQPAPITQTITHTDEFCINADGSATVNVSGGNGSYTYTWSTNPVQTNSVATNLAAGNYTLDISDLKNCKGQAVITIGNISNMLAQIQNKTDVSCNGSCNGTATATISGGSGPYTYNWLSIPNATNQSVSNLCPGQYTVKVTDALGCFTTTPLTITEPPAMSYSVNGINVICSGNNTTLSSTVNGGSPGYTYNWQPGNLSGPSVNVSPLLTTGYSLTVTDSKGCVGAIKVYSVIVNAPISINAGANSLSVCPNVSTSITVNPTGGDGNYSYIWQPGNFNTNNITVNVQSTTIYTVTISDGCGSTPISNTVNVNVFPIANPNFTVTNKQGCEPFCTQFSNLTSGNTTALWTFGDFSPPVQSPVVYHCYNNDGVYSVMLTVTNSFGCKSSVIKNNYITVYGKPKADFIQKPKDINLNENTGTFENTSVSAVNFNWSLDGVLISKSKDLEHQFFDTGCFVLQLVALNGNSCSDTTKRDICVKEGFNFWAPNAFSPDNDGVNDYFIPKGTGWMNDTYSLEIMNRWGITVFKTKDVLASWDGKVGGTKATDEIYVWKVYLKDIFDNEHELTGHVLIMR